MWGMSDSDDELRYPGSVKDMEVKEKDPPPSDVTGLALTEHFFGPSLSPVAATPAQWTQSTVGVATPSTTTSSMIEDGPLATLSP